MLKFDVTELSGTVRRITSAAGSVLAVNTCRAVASAGIVSTVLWLSGCYAYAVKPMSDVPPNASIAADISDVGRVALGTRVGSEVARVEGKLVQRTDTSMDLQVTQVTYLSGRSDAWQGQQVTLKPQDVKMVTQKTFSRSKTALLIGVVVVGLVATILSLNFLGITSGDPSRDKGTDPPPES